MLVEIYTKVNSNEPFVYSDSCTDKSTDGHSKILLNLPQQLHLYCSSQTCTLWSLLNYPSRLYSFEAFYFWKTI